MFKSSRRNRMEGALDGIAGRLLEAIGRGPFVLQGQGQGGPRPWRRQ